VQVHGAIVDTVDVDLGVRPLDAVEMRRQRVSIIMQSVNWSAALPPDFHSPSLARVTDAGSSKFAAGLYCYKLTS
jgi:hypothetical protein